MTEDYANLLGKRNNMYIFPVGKTTKLYVSRKLANRISERNVTLGFQNASYTEHVDNG